ncbi:MAG: M3 family metallopeptidase [Candidatus Gracilibacteria bacterium]
MLKQKILQELENTKIPDLKFLFSDEILYLALEVLNELLEEEKKDFDELVNTEYEGLDLSSGTKVKDPLNKAISRKQEQRDSSLLSEGQKKITFDIFIDFSRLDLFFSLLNHLQNVKSGEKIRNIIEEFEPKYVDFGNYIAYSKRYYDMLCYCRDNCEIDSEQKRILDLSIKSYEVKGINLEEEKQTKLKKISKRLSEISQKFGNNLLLSQKEFNYIFKTDETIKDIPENDLKEAKNKAIQKQEEGFLFDSSPSSYMAVMKYCTDSQVRKYFYTSKHQFASSGKYDNREIILEILKLRDKKAKILGYKNYAELSLVFKMADTPDSIISLIDDVTVKAKNKANEEIIQLIKYFKLEKLDHWDMSYYSRIYKEKEFKFDEKELKKYFEFDKVLNGLFEIVNKLYGVEMREIIIDSYSPLLKFYEVYKDDKLISYFIGDYFYNPDKRSGAWCDNFRPKMGNSEKGQILPIIVNVCAFAKGEKGKTLLNFIDVETMFHEFGHAIHEMLSISKYSDLTGFNVEWDFVELPSQLMENWATEKESLKIFAKHNETGEDIPEDMLLIMKKLEKYGTGNFTLRQNEFASLDMHLHNKAVPDNIDELDDYVLGFVNNYSISPKEKDYKMYTSFSHIFDGGYGAGYYSYMRAEIIEAQVWDIFKKKGIFDKEIANKFLDTILSAGSIKKASELFYDFAGVPISSKAFLERKGF